MHMSSCAVACTRMGLTCQRHMYVRLCTHMHKCTARPATETVCALHGRASGALSLYQRCMLVCLNVRTYWHDLHCQCATTLRIAPWPPQSSLIPRADRIGQRNDRRSVYHNNLTSRSDQIRPSGRVVVFRVRVVGQPGINGTDPTTHESMMLSRLLWCYTSVSMNKRSLWSCVASSKIK
jgi:hypothetical protein